MGGQLIAGDYKPQSSDLVSDFDQTNTNAHLQLHALTPLTHTHTQSVKHKLAHVSIRLIHQLQATEQKFTILMLLWL